MANTASQTKVKTIAAEILNLQVADHEKSAVFSLMPSDDYEKWIALTRVFSESSAHTLSDKQCTQVTNGLEQLRNFLVSCRKSIQEQNFNADKEAIKSSHLAGVGTSFDRLQQVLCLLVAMNSHELFSKFTQETQSLIGDNGKLLAAAQGTAEGIAKQLQTGIDQQKLEIENNRKELAALTDKTATDVKAALTEARKAALMSGVGTHAKVFEIQATAHQKAASAWLITCSVITVIIIGVIIAYVVESHNWINATMVPAAPSPAPLAPNPSVPNSPPQTSKSAEEKTNFQIVAYSLNRILVITTLVFALHVCVKNYRANQHLRVVNLHRHNALVTFETFVKAGEGDASVRNSILLESVHCIFSPSITGFLGKDEDALPTTNAIQLISELKGKPDKS